MRRIEKAISLAMSKRLSVLLEGPHGVGKTQMVRSEAERLGLNLKYYSAATLDPWADLVGVPVPTSTNAAETDGARHLEFIRPRAVDSAQIIFFDELNRSHPRVQNAVMEILQFRTLNGESLPNLECVWAAINPPDDGYYDVTDLDPALTDRFAVHLAVSAVPSIDYYCEIGIPTNVASALVAWWHGDLDAELRRFISPRRLEYIGRNIGFGIDLRFCIPSGRRVPLANLTERLKGKNNLPFKLTRAALINRQDELLTAMKANHEVMLAVSEQMAKSVNTIPNCVPLFMALTSELQARLVADNQIARALKNMARHDRHDVATRPLADRLTAMGVMR